MKGNESPTQLPWRVCPQGSRGNSLVCGPTHRPSRSVLPVSELTFKSARPAALPVSTVITLDARATTPSPSLTPQVADGQGNIGARRLTPDSVSVGHGVISLRSRLAAIAPCRGPAPPLLWSPLLTRAYLPKPAATSSLCQAALSAPFPACGPGALLLSACPRTPLGSRTSRPQPLT